MPTVLNNTQRNFHAFSAGVPGGPLMRTEVKPGFNTLTDNQLARMKEDPHFLRAVSQDAVIIGGNKTDIRESEVKPLEKLPESPDAKIKKENQPVTVVSETSKKSKHKKKRKIVDSDFGDFE